MNTKRTILSEKDLNLIEDLIVKYGVIVTFEQIYDVLKERMTRQAIRNLVNRLFKNGWLVRIKKGLYVVSSMESRGFLTLSVFKTAQILVEDSYVSFEKALQHHGMFDQYLRTIVSVSQKAYKTVELQDTNYKFIKTKKRLFYGWEERRVENYLVKIATTEKAVLDMLCFARNIYSIDLVLEKLKQYKNDFDFARLNEFSEKQTTTVQRIAGFLLDKIGVDSEYLHNLVKDKKNCSYMTKDSTEFNARWRLYYHKHFDSL